MWWLLLSSLVLNVLTIVAQGEKSNSSMLLTNVVRDLAFQVDLPYIEEDKELFDSKLVIFNAMDHDYAKYFQPYILNNKAYAEKHGYPYMYDGRELGLENPPPHTSHLIHSPPHLRIFAALNLLTGKTDYQGPPVDWIVYFDTDLTVMEREIPLQLMLKLARDHARKLHGIKATECEFISQDYPHIINSGFWMMKNSSFSIDLLHRWIKDSEEQGRMQWNGDQGPLQNAVLHMLLQYNKHNTGGKVFPYHDECRAPLSHQPHDANLCWKANMAKLGAPFEQRAIGPICLLPPSLGAPWRANMHGEYQPGDLLRHQKELTAEEIAGSGDALHYDPLSAKLTYHARQEVDQAVLPLIMGEDKAKLWLQSQHQSNNPVNEIDEII